MNPWSQWLPLSQRAKDRQTGTELQRTRRRRRAAREDDHGDRHDENYSPVIALTSVLFERGMALGNSDKWNEYFAKVISEERGKAADEQQKRDDCAEALKNRAEDARRAIEKALSEIVHPMMQAFARQFSNCDGPRDIRKDDVLTCSIQFLRPEEGRSPLGVEVTLTVNRDCQPSICVKAVLQAPTRGRAERQPEIPFQPFPSDMDNWLQEELGTIARQFVQRGV